MSDTSQLLREPLLPAKWAVGSEPQGRKAYLTSKKDDERLTAASRSSSLLSLKEKALLLNPALSPFSSRKADVVRAIRSNIRRMNEEDCLKFALGFMFLAAVMVALFFLTTVFWELRLTYPTIVASVKQIYQAWRWEAVPPEGYSGPCDG